MYFQEKVVWVTGASSGIGEGVAYALAKQGAKLILSARRVEALEVVRAKCMDRGAGVGDRGSGKERQGRTNSFRTSGEEREASVPYLLPLDISDLEALPAKAEEAQRAFGRIDILINNAGIGFRGNVLDTEIAVHQRVMQVNYFGQIALTKAVLPYMMAQQQSGRSPAGHIVVVSSLTGKLPVPGRSAYCASKHALQGFFDSLRGEVHRYGIRVTIVCPGFVRTEISENALLADGSKRGRKPGTGHPDAMSPAESARHILYAIRTGKEEYDYGGAEKWAVPARKWLPWVYSRAIRRIGLS